MSEKTLSAKLAELDELVAWFENDDLDVVAAIEKFDEVTKLSESIKHDLDGLENKITVLKQKFDEG